MKEDARKDGRLLEKATDWVGTLRNDERSIAFENDKDGD